MLKTALLNTHHDISHGALVDVEDTSFTVQHQIEIFFYIKYIFVNTLGSYKFYLCLDRSFTRFRFGRSESDWWRVHCYTYFYHIIFFLLTFLFCCCFVARCGCWFSTFCMQRLLLVLRNFYARADVLCYKQIIDYRLFQFRHKTIQYRNRLDGNGFSINEFPIVSVRVEEMKKLIFNWICSSRERKIEKTNER